MLPKAPKEEYSRAEVRRHFGLSERQLRSWERQALLPTAEWYTFPDLIAIQTLLKLREKNIQPRQIGRALEALRQKLDVKKPLSELRIVSNGRKIAVQFGGEKWEALTGQILFDFDASSLGGLKSFPSRKQQDNRIREAEGWFQKGLELEEAGAPPQDAIDAYRKALELNPSAAGAYVNLGTICYRLRRYNEAEKYYREAITADPNYPLAEFNLGNLYDEQGRAKEAYEHYMRSLELNPNYGDAHFNLALLCERSGDTLRAVHHWKSYLKLDRSGQWAEIARKQLDRLRQLTVIQSR